VAPRHIGQAIPETFCERIGIPFTDVATLKTQFQERETFLKILSQLESKTFDAPILYYNKKNDTLQYIKQNNKVVDSKSSLNESTKILFVLSFKSRYLSALYGVIPKISSLF
jgi:hypothetical protein